MNVYFSYKLYISKEKGLTDEQKKEYLYNLIASSPNKTGPLTVHDNNEVHTLYSVRNRIQLEMKMYLQGFRVEDTGQINIIVKCLDNKIEFSHELFDNFLMCF